MEETQSLQTTGQPSENPGPHQVVSGQQNATSACTVQSCAHETNAQGVHQQQSQPEQQQQQPQQSATPSTQTKTAPNMQQAECDWTQEHYALLADWLDKGAYGEDIMRTCGIRRRKELQARVQTLSQRVQKFFNLRWEDTSFMEKGKRGLPPAKVSSDGSLRISKERLARMGLAFPPGATFRLQKTNPHAFNIERMS